METDATKDSLSAWEANAEFWDSYMGDDSNRFHREVVRPRVTELLHPQKGDWILDISCGNGNYSAYMAERGARVVAFDYSKTMVKLAQKRQKAYLDRIDFQIVDATNKTELLTLKRDRRYHKAVSLMAIMDISDIVPLFEVLDQLLDDNGIFVFATQHPCFVTLTEQYLTPHSYLGEAIAGQPQLQCYYHRSLQDIFHLCFQNGFVVDGFYEESYGNKEKPDVIIVRVKKATGKKIQSSRARFE